MGYTSGNAGQQDCWAEMDPCVLNSNKNLVSFKLHFKCIEMCGGLSHGEFWKENLISEIRVVGIISLRSEEISMYAYCGKNCPSSL